jgi:pyruvate kinase
MTRRARIVCTLGPASQSLETIRGMIGAGMDVARLNFSHGEHGDHRASFDAVRAASKGVRRAVAVMADLQGPKIRLGRFRGGFTELVPGAEFRITTEEVVGDATRASTTYAELARDVKPGDMLLIDDGRVRLEVLDTDGRELRARVIEGGPISDNKGINLPGSSISSPALTPKDVEDLRFALSMGVDAVAVSFVRRGEDAEPARKVMHEVGRSVPLVAKIETAKGVEHLEEILKSFDGMMVARGDLGVELPLEHVPLIQKETLRRARALARPTIVATQMLESMIHQARPTRAEASDVANAVLDGADALMLSAETAVGDYPVAAVSTMARLIETAEAHGLAGLRPRESLANTPQEAIAAGAVRVAHDLGARALAAYTQSGSTVRSIASHRGVIPLVAFTPDEEVSRQLALVWGVETFVMRAVEGTDDLVEQVNRAMLEMVGCGAGELVVIVAGTPPGRRGGTNMLRVHRLA